MSHFKRNEVRRIVVVDLILKVIGPLLERIDFPLNISLGQRRRHVVTGAVFLFYPVGGIDLLQRGDHRTDFFQFGQLNDDSEIGRSDNRFIPDQLFRILFIFDQNGGEVERPLGSLRAGVVVFQDIKTIPNFSGNPAFSVSGHGQY